MNRENYTRNLRQAADGGDWQRAERLGRSYGWSLLGQAIRRAIGAASARIVARRGVRRVPR
jgi:hypothetical protein